jgi:hypothetical protein
MSPRKQKQTYSTHSGTCIHFLLVLGRRNVLIIPAEKMKKKTKTAVSLCICFTTRFIIEVVITIYAGGNAVSRSYMQVTEMFVLLVRVLPRPSICHMAGLRPFLTLVHANWRQNLRVHKPSRNKERMFEYLSSSLSGLVTKDF